MEMIIIMYFFSVPGKRKGNIDGFTGVFVLFHVRAFEQRVINRLRTLLAGQNENNTFTEEILSIKQYSCIRLQESKKTERCTRDDTEHWKRSRLFSR